jgi:exosome complex component CSL4
MPKIGQEVLGVVTRIRLQAANVQILAVAGKALHGSLAGVVRLQDIRKHDIDKLHVAACFKPGDIIKARILSLGDSRAYFLTTAESELGVVVAFAEDGVKLIPLNWEQMVDTRTGRKEPRKVAKPLVLVKG